MSIMYLIPIVFIGGIFLVFYLFKDKFTGKYVQAHDEASKAWSEDKESVIKEMFSNPEKFKMLQDAVGETPIECMCPCEPKKGLGKKLLKGGVELLTSHQSFDMSLYFFAIAGDELHLLQSNGEMVVSHDAFTLSNLRQVDIRPEGLFTKAAGFLSSNNATASSKESIFFSSKGEDYSFKLLEQFQCHAKFEVEKSYSEGKFGVNPFYRVSNCTQTENTLLMGMYGPDTIAQFREAIQKLK